MRQTPTEISLMLEPKLARHVVDTLSQRIQQLLTAGQPPVVMCAPQIRLAFRRFFETDLCRADRAFLRRSPLAGRNPKRRDRSRNNIPDRSMEPTSFIAASAEEAVAQIRAKLGPEAVVLNVRRLPATAWPGSGRSR